MTTKEKNDEKKVTPSPSEESESDDEVDRKISEFAEKQARAIRFAQRHDIVIGHQRPNRVSMGKMNIWQVLAVPFLFAGIILVGLLGGGEWGKNPVEKGVDQLELIKSYLEASAEIIHKERGIKLANTKTLTH